LKHDFHENRRGESHSLLTDIHEFSSVLSTLPNLCEISYKRSAHNAVNISKLRENLRSEGRIFRMCVNEITFTRVQLKGTESSNQESLRKFCVMRPRVHRLQSRYLIQLRLLKLRRLATSKDFAYFKIHLRNISKRNARTMCTHFNAVYRNNPRLYKHHTKRINSYILQFSDDTCSQYRRSPDQCSNHKCLPVRLSVQN
jgi:hypothetical protein